MRMWRVLWVLAWATWAVALPAAPWVRHEVAGVHVFLRPGQGNVAAQLDDVMRAELPRIAATLGVRAVRPFPIYAYTSRVDFLRDTGVDPELQGLSFPHTGTILLDATNDPLQTHNVLSHELTHSLLDQRLGGRIGALPIWVNEGIAGHLSDPVSPSQLEGVSQLIHRDGVLSLDELDAGFTRGPYRAAAYLQSRSMIAWLELRRPGALSRLLQDIAAGSSFTGALHQAAGLTPHAWWEQWQQSVPGYMRWLMLLASPVVYAPLALALVWAALRRLLRKPEEDDETAEDDAREPPEDDTSESPGVADDVTPSGPAVGSI